MSTEVAIRDEQHYLATVADVRDLCERISTVGEAKGLADQARLAQVWAERARLGQSQVNLAAMARLWAERRAGQLLIASRQNGERTTGSGGRELQGVTLGELGVTKNESARMQKLAAIPEDEFQEALATAAEAGRVTAMSVHYSSSTSEWETPQDLFDLLAGEFPFDLDVCATADNAKCAAFYTAEQDGLAQPWAGTCWMNPPYGRVIGDWVKKAYESAQAGATVVCLVPARVDTGWWWDYARYGEVRFLRGRLKFGGGDMGAPFPSVLVIFGRPASVVWWDAWKP